MGILVLVGDKYLWLLAWLLQSIGYYFVLKAMKEDTSYAIIPFFAEWHLSKFLFEKMRTFYRPFAITMAFVLAGFYMGPMRGMGKLFIIAAIIVYSGFLFRLYLRLRKAFNKSILLLIPMLIFSPIFLFLVSFNGTFQKPVFEEENQNFITKMKNGLITTLAVAEVLVISGGIAFFAMQSIMPRFMVNNLQREIYNETKDVKADGNILSREEALGANASIIDTIPHSRDYFFKDHSKDENVVVLSYIVGSDLENAHGLATANLNQMIDATKQGDHLSFVLQAGGSSRWFTSGIEENANGRYLIKNGKLTYIDEIDPTLSLSDPKQLEDFIVWATKAYPADRYMLVLWDHGGGFSLGYGIDNLNKRAGQDTMYVSEFANALKNAGVKFDLIGFDACLMQNLETAFAIEPYADYYLASEEVESGLGWTYTSAFGKLAQDPTIPTLEFAKELISAFDVYNTIAKDGKVDSQSTLSIVDLTMVKPVYEELLKVLKASDDAIKEDGESFAEIALAANKAYTFHNNEQIDLVNYLRILDSVDYRGKICAEDACLGVADYVLAMIPYQNKNSAEGIYGMSFTFPVQFLMNYDAVYKQLKAFNMNEQMNFLNDYFSIVAAQQKGKPDSSNIFSTALGIEMDYTYQEWYVPGFENYDSTEEFVDLPLVETPDGYYRVELPEKIQKIIVDTKVAVFQKTKDGKLRSLGKDYIGFDGEDGSKYIGFDDKWIYMNGHLINYEAGQSRLTDDGTTIFTGTTKAKLNFKDDIIIYLEWEPIKEGGNQARTATILGYTLASDETAYTSKGYTDFKSGDRLNFYFDYYNESDGTFSHTEADSNLLIVTDPARLSVQDESLKNCDVVYFGVLTDAYQRELTTQRIEEHMN